MNHEDVKAKISGLGKACNKCLDFFDKAVGTADKTVGTVDKATNIAAKIKNQQYIHEKNMIEMNKVAEEIKNNTINSEKAREYFDEMSKKYLEIYSVMMECFKAITKENPSYAFNPEPHKAFSIFLKEAQTIRKIL